MFHVSTQGVDEHMLNVHYYYYENSMHNWVSTFTRRTYNLHHSKINRVLFHCGYKHHSLNKPVRTQQSMLIFVNCAVSSLKPIFQEHPKNQLWGVWKERWTQVKILFTQKYINYILKGKFFFKKWSSEMDHFSCEWYGIMGSTVTKQTTSFSDIFWLSA